MAPQMSDMLVCAGQVAFWLAAGLATAGIARELGIGKPGALTGAAVVMLAPGFIQQATVPRVDIAFAAWLLIAFYFTMRWGRSRRAGHLVLFGAALGLLTGTKSIGLMYSAIPVLYFLYSLRGRGAKRAARDVATAAALAFAFGGFWYARNWITTGNPLFPLDVSLLGISIFPGAYGREAMRAFHSSDPTELGRIGLFFLGFWTEAFIMFGAATGFIYAFLLRKRPLKGRLYVLAAPWLLVASFWLLNPYNNLTNGRFLFPAFFMFGIYAALAIDEAKDLFGKIWLWLAPAAFVFSSLPNRYVSLSEDNDHLYKLWTTIFRTIAGHNEGLLGPARTAVILVAGALACAALFMLLKRTRIARCAAGIAAAVLLAFGMKASWNYQTAHKYEWYGAFPAGSAWGRLNERSAAQPLRVAAVGNERMYGLFGNGLRNTVLTVNIDRHTNWRFHDYWRAARRRGEKMPANTERPQWHREGGSAEAWIDNLRKQKADIVFATTLEPIARGAMAHDDYNFPVEVAWAEKRPNVFMLLYANSEVRVFGFMGGKAK